MKSTKSKAGTTRAAKPKRVTKREQAKAKLTQKVRRLQLPKSKALPAPAGVTASTVIDGALGALAALGGVPDGVLEEPNGQRVIAGAGPRRDQRQAQPGDDNEYVLTLRIKRGDIRQVKVIAAILGYPYPASWVIDVMRKAIAVEMAKERAA